MTQYEVKLSPDALLDIRGLGRYISEVLHAPHTASCYVRELRSEIESLQYMPNRYPLVSDEPWKSKGVHRMLEKNYFIYYKVDDLLMSVYVVAVVYAKKDQINALADMDFGNS